MEQPNFLINDEAFLRKIVSEEIEKALSEYDDKKAKSYEDLPDYLTRKQAAEILNVSTSSIDGWAKSGKLTKYKKGRSVKFEKREVLNFYKILDDGE